MPILRRQVSTMRPPITKDEAAMVLRYVLARPDLYATLLWLAQNDVAEEEPQSWKPVTIR